MGAGGVCTQPSDRILLLPGAERRRVGHQRAGSLNRRPDPHAWSMMPAACVLVFCHRAASRCMAGPQACTVWTGEGPGPTHLVSAGHRTRVLCACLPRPWSSHLALSALLDNQAYCALHATHPTAAPICLQLPAAKLLHTVPCQQAQAQQLPACHACTRQRSIAADQHSALRLPRLVQLRSLLAELLLLLPYPTHSYASTVRSGVVTQRHASCLQRTSGQEHSVRAKQIWCAMKCVDRQDAHADDAHMEGLQAYAGKAKQTAHGICGHANSSCSLWRT